jgi:hypothetical protein
VRIYVFQRVVDEQGESQIELVSVTEGFDNTKPN